MEGEAIASRILELGPSGAHFLGPVIIEVPHFAALRGKEREIVILRSDNGETWREHTLEATEDAVQEVLQESFDADEMSQLEDLNTNRITRILTTDFPQYFAIVSRIRQEVHAIGPEGGVVNSTVVPQVQAVFPQGALTKKIKVGLQAQPIPPELAAKLLGNRVAVSPIVTVEPRRRKFHKPISLTIPVPTAAGKGMINQYNNTDGTPTLRLLCSITGGTTRAQWEDVTGSTPLTFVNDCVNFTTTVSARFWLMDCRNIEEATKMATELYREAIHAPFMAKFVIFSKRHEVLEARLRVFCMTDDKEDKTLEQQEHFTEVAKSRDVEVLEGKSHFIEFGGNLVPITKSGDQLSLRFFAFRENRIPFNVKVKDPHSEPMGRVAFMKEPKGSRGDAPQTPICNLNVALPDNITPDVPGLGDTDSLAAIQNKYSFLRDQGYGKFDTIHRADLRISDIGNLVGSDWVNLAHELDISDSDINIVKSEYPDSDGQQAIVMLRLWLSTQGNQATGNSLEKALRRIGREDIVNKCMFNVELVTDETEQSVAKTALEDVSGFDAFKAELGPSRNSTLKRVDENGEPDDGGEEVEEKFMAEERITEKEEFTPQQYSHQSIVVTQETDDLAAAADDDDNTTTTETTTHESIIRTTTTSTTYTTNVENLQQFDNKREEESVVIQEIKPEFEREPSPETIEPQIIEPQLVACTFGQEEEPNVEVTREESSNVTTTHDGTQVFTQTRKTTITTTTISEQPQEFEPSYPGEDVVDKGDVEELAGADTVYEREEQKYVAEEKDFTQPQFFIAEEVKDFGHLEQQPIVEETFIETKVIDSNMAEPIIEREDISEYREAPWKEEVSHETMRQVSETMVIEETRKISTSASEHEVEHEEEKRKSSSSSSSSSSDDDQEGVRSKEIKHHYEEEAADDINEQVVEESEEHVAMRLTSVMSTSTPPSTPTIIQGEKPHAETSLVEAAVLAQHEQQYTEEKHDEEKRSRKSSTSSASSHATSTSSKASSTKGYPVKEELDDDEEDDFCPDTDSAKSGDEKNEETKT
jgi:ankyrin